MSTGTTGSNSTTLRYALVLVVPTVLVGVALGWALAAPDPVQAQAVLRGPADALAATVLGLAALPRLHDRLRPTWRLLAVFGGLWVIVEFVLLALEAADVVGVAAVRLSARDFGDYLAHVSGGQIGVAILIGTVALTGYSALAYRRPERATTDLVLVFAAVVLVLRPITGHMSQQTLGSVLAAIHALAAATWFGVLLALALVVRARGEWAVVLPRYSSWALPAVVLVTVTGMCNGLVRIADPAALLTTGYGRILLAKTVLLLALIGLGWWWRRGWVPRAAAHRFSAEASLRRAVIEVSATGVVFGLAATLSVTA